MRTYVATYKIYTPFSLDKVFDIPFSKNIKYKFDEDKMSENTICYLTIIANNRLELRKYKKESMKILKGLGKVELIIGVG